VSDAHSVEELERDLSQREQHFQQIDKPAPEFSLRDANGAPVALSDLRGKVVVLNFIYTKCPDVCPLHAERDDAGASDPDDRSPGDGRRSEQPLCRLDRDRADANQENDRIDERGEDRAPAISVGALFRGP
jgi:hypothetical protein